MNAKPILLTFKPNTENMISFFFEWLRKFWHLSLPEKPVTIYNDLGKQRQWNEGQTINSTSKKSKIISDRNFLG